MGENQDKRKSSMLATLRTLQASKERSNRLRLAQDSTSGVSTSGYQNLTVNHLRTNFREALSRRTTRIKPAGSPWNVVRPGLSSRSSGQQSRENHGSLNSITLKFKLSKKQLLKQKVGKFKRYAKFFTLLFRIWKFHLLRIQDEVNTQIPLEKIPHHHRKLSSLLFDVTEYRANREIRLSSDTRRILSKNPSERTADELQHVQVALQAYNSIAEYPVDMQEKIAKHAWIESYGPKRVIIREGHVPMTFYLILGGSVAVTQSSAATESGSHSTDMLTKGEVFGEEEMKTGSRRNVTVISKEPVEFLCMSKNDYENIFLSGGVRSLYEDSFLKQILFFRRWPIHILKDNPKKVAVNFYKRGCVIEKNTNKTEWIYIIKSGSCNLLKKLTSHKQKQSLQSKQNEIKALRKLSYHQHEQYLDERIKEENDSLVSSQRAYYQLSLPQINITTGHMYRKHLVTENSEVESDVGNTSGPLNGDFGKLTSRRKSKQEFNRFSRLPSISKGPYLSASPGPLSPLPEIPQKKEATPNVPKTIFVTIKTLVKGNTFGLSSLLYDNQPSLSLVSNGVECVMINKKFYLENAPQYLHNILRNEVYPYPSDAELQASLENRLTWDTHKKAVMMQYARHHTLKKVNLEDSRAKVTIPLHKFKY